MRVKLVTTITTFIEVRPDNTDKIEVARKEIFGRYIESTESDEENERFIEGVKLLQTRAVVHDDIISTEVSHNFGEANE